jgi:hypothetical protein
MKETNTVTEASSLISRNAAGAKCPHTDGDIVKKNIYEVISVLYSKSAILQRLNWNYPISLHAMERRMSHINVDSEY